MAGYEPKVINFWNRFRVLGYRCEGGWSLRVFLGVAMLNLYWNYTDPWSICDRTTGVGVGYIPRDAVEGGNIPYRHWTLRHPVFTRAAGGGKW